MNKLPLKSWEEHDCLTKARKWYCHKSGEIRKAKRRYSKRVRRWGKCEALNQIEEMWVLW
ncbi:MAG: hypothetical protein U9P90_01525 [Patescibacteria group bacterium]|nr:hypothetical protein [Patescibacteria group bacterium]